MNTQKTYRKDIKKKTSKIKNNKKQINTSNNER